jgi:DNA polymerase-3 subunit epsilon
MKIEKRRYRTQEAQIGYRLAQCRQHYGLPDTPQHDALADARATAELLLAQLS